MRQDNSLGLKI